MTKFWISSFFLLIGLFQINNGEETNTSSSDPMTRLLTQSDKTNNFTEIENQLAMQVLAIIEHFKQEDPIGLPALPLPDPAEIPDETHRFAGGSMLMSNTKLHGISKFRIVKVTVDVEKLRATCKLFFENLSVQGDYSSRIFLSKSAGPFSINLKDVVVEGTSELEVSDNGKLKTGYVNGDIEFKNLTMDFQNIASMFKSILDSADTLIFNSVKPKIIEKSKETIRAIIDAKLDDFMGDTQLPNSLRPIDTLLADVRRQIKQKGYDPLHVDDYNYPGVLGVKISDTWVSGVSSIHRLGEMNVEVVDNKALITMDLGTQELSGTTKWSVLIAKGAIERSGIFRFSIDYLKIHFVVTQPLNLNKKLIFDDLQVDLGNIQVRSSGLGTADYLVELVANVFPNILRNLLMDALEKPLTAKIQNQLNKIDMEELIKEKVAEFQQTRSITFDINQHLEL